jgi:3-deoxy-manno-octulosonate cytidylyltransferase (CMP-KDO synthetase)
MAATRLPGKPLADINGKPMIVHMLDRAREADIGPVAVACGDPEIAAAVRAAGGTAVLTDPALPSGSDRVHAALAELDPDGKHDVIVNLQGDFPTMDPDGLRLVVTPLQDAGIDIGTLVVPIRDDQEANTASFVKAACAFADGQTIAPALYFSRQPIP